MTVQNRIDAVAGQVSRRDVLKGAGGLTFAIAIGAGGSATLINPALAKETENPIGAWVRIAPDNSITIVTPAAEMGQGSMTGIPTALAEELDADWSRVTLEMAPAEPETYGYTLTRGGRSFKLMGIFGSFAMRMYYPQVRIVGAQARKVLIQAAANKWGVAPGSLKTEPSVVVHPASGRRMTYGEIAAFAKVPAKMPAVAKSELKKRSDFRLIGKSVPRRDIPEKVNGSAMYSMDVQLPGMVYASTVHSPVQKGTPVSWNDAEIKQLKGVLDIVKLKTGIAVVADSMEHVLAARGALEVKWKASAKAAGFDSVRTLEVDYAKVAADPKSASKTLDRKGDDKAAFAAAAKTFKQTYRSDYGYHAQMEPLNAVARFNGLGDKVEIWEGTQAPGRTRSQVAKALGMTFGQVIHHQHYLGGGFGRRSNNDFTVEAALIARQVKRPVKMIWTREEDIAYGMLRPQALLCMEAALDKSGKVTGWRQCIVGDGKRLLQSGIKIPYYKIPNQHIEQRGQSHNIRLKHWRAVAHPFNMFAHEAFIDEMAKAADMDPLAFRRKNMSLSKKAQAVYDKIEKMSDWGAKRPAGRAVGLSLSERSGSLGAGVVEISLDRPSGKIRVHKVWLAIDGGIIVQPEAARLNLESGIIYGISSVLKERATIKNGAVEQSNFHDYEVLRMSEAPDEMHVDFVDSGTKPSGIGEIGNPFVSAAVANAFFALTGKRLYHMPFTPDRVLEALKG